MVPPTSRSPAPAARAAPRLAFTKLSAAGNDFLLVEDFARTLTTGVAPALARRLCHRRHGVGADGIILLRRGGRRYRVVFYNADGSRPACCGNGLRAAAWYAVHRGLAPARHVIEAADGPHRVEVAGGAVRVSMHVTTGGIQRHTLRGVPAAGYTIAVGVPHCVIPVDDITAGRWAVIGPALRHERPWGRRGCNIDLLQLDTPGEGRLRTFERGVDEETWACGTGAVAAAVVAHHLRRARWPLRLHPPGGLLEVSRTARRGRYWLAGPVHEVCTGTCVLAEEPI